MSVELQTAVDIAGIVSGLTAAVVAGFVYRQMKQTDKHLNMTQQDMDSRLRPWIGAAAGGLSADGNGLFIFNYQNYGQIPAHNLRISVELSDIRVDRKSLLERTAHEEKRTVLMPNEIKHNKRTFDFNKRQPAGSSVFVGIIIRYEYGHGKEGLYGARVEYKLNTNGIDFFDEWTDVTHES